MSSLKELNPRRQWNLILVNVQEKEAELSRERHFRHLVYPLQTVLDDSIGCALWFAARGRGVLYSVQEGKGGQDCLSSAKVCALMYAHIAFMCTNALCAV